MSVLITHSTVNQTYTYDTFDKWSKLDIGSAMKRDVSIRRGKDTVEAAETWWNICKQLIRHYRCNIILLFQIMCKNNSISKTRA